MGITINSASNHMGLRKVAMPKMLSK